MASCLSVRRLVGEVSLGCVKRVLGLGWVGVSMRVFLLALCSGGPLSLESRRGLPLWGRCGVGSRFPVVGCFRGGRVVCTSDTTAALGLGAIVSSISGFCSFRASGIFEKLRLLTRATARGIRVSESVMTTFVNTGSSRVMFADKTARDVGVMTGNVRCRSSSRVVISVLRRRSGCLP